MRSKRGNSTFDSSNTRYNIARILAGLKTGKTYAQLSAELYMSTRSLSRYMAHLMAEPNRRVFIRKYVLIDAHHCPVFAIGSRPNAPKPGKQDERERNAKYRAKVRSCPEMMVHRRNYESARWATRKAVKTPNTWLSALGAV